MVMDTSGWFEGGGGRVGCVGFAIVIGRRGLFKGRRLDSEYGKQLSSSIGNIFRLNALNNVWLFA